MIGKRSLGKHPFASLDLVVLGTALLTAFVGLSFVWGGPGKKIVDIRERTARTEQESLALQEAIEGSRAKFLAGEEAELLRSLFEDQLTASEYFNIVLDELVSREPGGVQLLSAAVGEPERTANVARVGFELQVEAPFPTVGSFLRWLEEVYPAFQVNEFRMGSVGDRNVVHTTMAGALYMPRQ